MVRCLVLLGACLAALACAPSHRMVHTGNVYFEHCYGAEFNPEVSPGEREACWMAWLANYTRHQPAHRVDYAMRRVEAIQAGDQTLLLPGVPGGMSAPPVDPSLTKAGSAYPARVGANVATTEGDAGAPSHGCSDGCVALQTECSLGCPPDTPSCHALCKRDAEICRRGCY